jgi:ribosomal protein S20
MVVGIYFTKYSKAYPLNNHTALTVADKFVNKFICKFGVHSIIHTNQGRKFKSKLFNQMCILLKI